MGIPWGYLLVLFGTSQERPSFPTKEPEDSKSLGTGLSTAGRVLNAKTGLDHRRSILKSGSLCGFSLKSSNPQGVWKRKLGSKDFALNPRATHNLSTGCGWGRSQPVKTLDPSLSTACLQPGESPETRKSARKTLDPRLFRGSPCPQLLHGFSTACSRACDQRPPGAIPRPSPGVTAGASAHSTALPPGWGQQRALDQRG